MLSSMRYHTAKLHELVHEKKYFPFNAGPTIFTSIPLIRSWTSPMTNSLGGQSSWANSRAASCRPTIIRRRSERRKSAMSMLCFSARYTSHHWWRKRKKWLLLLNSCRNRLSSERPRMKRRQKRGRSPSCWEITGKVPFTNRLSCSAQERT